MSLDLFGMKTVLIIFFFMKNQQQQKKTHKNKKIVINKNEIVKTIHVFKDGIVRYTPNLHFVLFKYKK
jgi:hypothetical protein